MKNVTIPMKTMHGGKAVLLAKSADVKLPVGVVDWQYVQNAMNERGIPLGKPVQVGERVSR